MTPTPDTTQGGDVGYNQQSITITAHLSSHNDERDEQDEARWNELQERIATLIEDPRYEHIRPIVV